MKRLMSVFLWASSALIFPGCERCGSGDCPQDPEDAGPGRVIFEPFSPVNEDMLSNAEGTPFEGTLNSPAAVIEKNGRFYLFYNDNVNGWPPSDIQIGYAVSDDLKTWERNPTVTLSGENVPYLNGVNEHPSVASVIVEDDGSLVMYFDVFVNGTGKGVGRATANDVDGPWTVDPEMVLQGDAGSWDQHGTVSAHVVKDGNQYRMYYGVFLSGIINPEMAIGMATSDDGIHWTKYNDSQTNESQYALSDPVFMKGELGDWDSYKVEVPKVIKTSKGWVMMYRSDAGDVSWGVNSGYGMAISQDGISWERIQETPVTHEDHIGNWYTMWASAFLLHEGTYYLFIETDGPPTQGTRINALSYTGDLFEN